MPSTEIRRVVASKSADEIVTIVAGASRIPFSNEALVRVTAISLNRGELGRAQRAADGTLQIGWDFVGTIDTPAVDGTGPVAGFRVVGFSTRMEGWAELVAVPTSYIAPIPDGVSDAQAATLPVAGLTALHSIDAATSLLGCQALITGATGGVGMFAVQLAALAGATAFAQIRRAEQKGFIESLGEYPTIVTADGREFSEHEGFRLIIDGVSGAILANAIPALAPDGICVCYGVTDTPEIPVDISQFMRIGLARMMGFHLYAKSESSPPNANLPRLLSLVADGRLNCAIEREASWTEINSVAQDLIDRKFFGKAVLHID
jgi:NADPH2:quinone reductase